MHSLIALVRKGTFPKYLIASVIALGVDLGSFLALLEMGSAPMAASASAYMLGIVAHWLLSSRTVFATGVAERGPERTMQKAMFVISALIGLGITTAIVGAGHAMGLDPRLAKLAAVGVSFVVTWLLRERIVFRTRS
jgi:putative flippase GtrA